MSMLSKNGMLGQDLRKGLRLIVPGRFDYKGVGEEGTD
jgi:hypothetical protein